jgi:hypothetical protein
VLPALPSEIVSAIEQFFPWVLREGSAPLQMVLNDEHYPKLATIAELIERIPDALIRLQGAEMAEFIFIRFAIEDALELYRRQREMPMREQGLIRRAELTGLGAFGSKNPILALWMHLSRFPDTIPVEGTAELPFFSDTELRKVLASEISDVSESIAGREWKAATVLGGAVLEAILYWSVSGMPVERTALKSKPAKAIEKWKLAELIDVARDLDIITEATQKLAHLARDARNLVHPAAVQRERRDCDKATSQTVAAAIEAVVRDIEAFCQTNGRIL